MRATPPRRASRLVAVAVIAVSLGLAGAWSYVAQRQLAASIGTDAPTSLERGRVLFEALRARTQEGLRAQSRLLVEDPRLKSTLATEGIDEATVADILADLGRLRRSGFLLVLSPEGRVFAEAGADELRGLDVAASSVVKRARGSSEAVAGAWVIGGRIVDLGISNVVVDRTVIAYLVVGEPVTAELVKAVADGAGVDAAIVLGTDVTLSSAPDDKLRALFASIAREPGGFTARTVEAAGDRYAAAMTELEETARSRPRLAIVRSLEPARASVETLRWLLWLPPILVLIALALSMSRTSRAS